ncbi:MAG TPA: fimbria/pilus outer membrane usher protein [Gammaproteobacteria bacterium]|nr:fimbria/pilus outer membrane usher protein [Gammaproteobacteria bacterium]
MNELDLPAIGRSQAPGVEVNPAEQRLYLEVWFGDRASGQLAEFRLHDGQLYATPGTLRTLGILIDPALAGPDGLLPLSALPGLTADYQAANQRVVLQVPASLRPTQRLGYRLPEPVQAQRDTGLLFNYDSYGRRQDGHDSLSVSGLVRVFGRLGALETSGVQDLGDGERGFRRLDTRWTYSHAASMTTWTAGDLVNGGLAWTRPVRLGGLQWRRNFGVRPDLISFPVPTFAGQATLPSSVELMVDNISQYRGEVGDGPFVIDSFPRISGAGDVTVVVRDALGRAVETQVPLYIDYQRLAPGLSDFSMEAGYLRTGFATREDDYGNELAASASYRRGLSDSFTIEGHAEYGDDLRLGGLGAVWSPSARYGVLNLSAARSSGLGTAGQHYSAGYQWMNRRVGFDLQAQRFDTGFRDLGDLAEMPSTGVQRDRLRALDRASVWMAVPRGSVGYSWVRTARAGNAGDERVQSLSWSQSWGRLFSYLSAYDSSRSGVGLSISVSLPLGETRSASLAVSRADDRTAVVAGLRQSPPYDGGLGWDLQAGHRDSDTFGQASATLRGDHGEATLGVDRYGGRIGYFGQAAGSVVWMGGGVFASRRVNDSFAVVSTNGVADVPVLYENRELGLTNRRGLFLVPDLRGWQRNHIAIDPDGLGAGYRLPPLELEATPADRGATLVEFDVARIHPALVALLDPAGAPIAAGTEGGLPGTDRTFMVGLDGVAWLEDHAAGDILELDTAAGTCRYTLPASASGEEGAVVKLGPLACEGTR